MLSGRWFTNGEIAQARKMSRIKPQFSDHNPIHICSALQLFCQGIQTCMSLGARFAHA